MKFDVTLPLFIWFLTEVHVLSSSESCADDAGIKTRLRELLLSRELSLQAGLTSDNPAQSCRSIQLYNPSRQSGYYWIRTSNGSSVQGYCHMEPIEQCGPEGGWLLLGRLDMRNTSEQCPGDLVYRDYGYDIRLCGRVPTNRGSCSSVVYNQNGVMFTEVCAWVRGYQYSQTNGFRPGTYNNPSETLNTLYGEVVSFTHSMPRQHLWSYGVGNAESNAGQSSCPCNEGSVGYTPPYVGDHWYCEAGYVSGNRNQLFLTDPLWDGDSCGGREGPCCTNSSLPWFHRQLDNTTAGIVELRACANEHVNNEDVPVEAFAIYIR